MSKSYKVVKKTINMGEMKGKTVYTVNPVSYGLLTTEDVAKQISATPLPVMKRRNKVPNPNSSMS